MDRGDALLGAFSRQVPRLRAREADQARRRDPARDRRRLRPRRPGRARRRHDDPHPDRGLGRRRVGRCDRRGRRAAAPGAAGGSTCSPTSPSTGFPGVYAVGDVANIPDRERYDAPPARLGRPAVRGLGRARTSCASGAGADATPFHYKDKGIMAMIGRNAAVAEVGKRRHEVEGPIAFAAWLGVHATPAQRRPQQDRRLPHLGLGLLRPRPRRHRRGLRSAEAHRLGRPRGGRPAHLARRPTRPPRPEHQHRLRRDHAMSDHYDVIIVGSGAGGGTLAHRLAPSGKRVLILERGDWLPREIENWDADGGLRRQPLRVDRPLVRREGQGLPAAGPLLRRRRDEVLRRRAVPAARARLRRAQAPRRDLTGLADRLRRARALLHPGRGALPGARRPGRGPHRAAGVGAVPLSRRSRTSRASSELFDDLAQVGLHPFHSPSGIMLDEAEPAFSPCIRCATCDGFPCLVHAKSDADVIAVRPALRARQRRPASATPSYAGSRPTRRVAR